MPPPVTAEVEDDLWATLDAMSSYELAQLIARLTERYGLAFPGGLKRHRYDYMRDRRDQVLEHVPWDACPRYAGAQEVAIRTFIAHLDAHEHPRGFLYCDEAMDLFRKLPAAEQGMVG